MLNKLTPKQQRFVDEYLIDLNATQAAIRAGYKNANKQGPRLLVNVGVGDAIAAKQKRLEVKYEITQEKVLKDIGLIQADAMQKVRDKDGNEVMLNHAAALKAAELQGRHLALFNDKLNVNHTFADMSDADLAAEIETLKDQLGKA